MNSYHKLLNQVRLLYGAFYRQRFILNLSDLSFVYSYRFATRYDVSLIRKISDLKKKPTKVGVADILSISILIHSRPVHWYLRFKISIYKCTQKTVNDHMYRRSNKDFKKKLSLQYSSLFKNRLKIFIIS